MGPLVDEPYHRKVCSYLRAVTDEGADVLPVGLYVEPTIFDVPAPESVPIREEIFGPMAAVTTVTSNEAVVRMANNTPHGLAASVFSGSMREALRGARHPHRHRHRHRQLSRRGGHLHTLRRLQAVRVRRRDNSVCAHEQYTELETI